MGSCTVQDTIYGTFTLGEPVLIDLLQSPAIQRLKKISQYGIPHEFYGLPGFTRYDHSVGVMLLLHKLGASVKEQIAGLLHDASHTAFSHLVDWVIGDRVTEDFQDKNHSFMLERYNVPTILEKYGFDFQQITRLESFSLLEQPAPDLCADRVDYALREFQLWAAPSIVHLCVNSLVCHHNKIAFSSADAAETFARAYLKCQTQHWGYAEYVLRYELFSQILKYALQHNIIALEDFYEDDSYIMNKLHTSLDTFILDELNYLHSRFRYRLTDQNPEYTLKKKFRNVDPSYIMSGKLYRLSETHHDFRSFLQTQRTINEQGIKATIIR